MKEEVKSYFVNFFKEEDGNGAVPGGGGGDFF